MKSRLLNYLKKPNYFALTGCVLYFCLSFIYNGLRPLKITLVTSVSPAGAEIIPFLKICGVMPAALFFTYLYTKLCQVMTRNQIFFAIVSIFLSYFLIFALILYPHNEFFAANSLAEFLKYILPSGFRGLLAMIEYWHISLFYVLCEVWSSAVMFVLFWGFMNETTSMSQASKVYPFYNLFGNLAAAVSGYIIHKLSFLNLSFAFLPSSSEIYCCFFINIMLSVSMGLLALFLFHKLEQKTVVHNQTNKNLTNHKKSKDKNQINYTFLESIVMVLKSRYLLCLLILVVSYNAVFILFDTLWNQSVKEYFGSNQIEIVRFLADVQIVKGVISTVLAFCVPFLIKYIGWKKSALITPIFLLISAIFFFPLLFFKNNTLLNSFFYDLFNIEIIWIIVYFGGLQNAVSRGSKYSIYDTTKEMAFIPLPLEKKRKGKAILDGIASRMGKASGAILIMVLLPFCSCLNDTIPYLAITSVLIIVGWSYSVTFLDKFIKKQNQENK